MQKGSKFRAYSELELCSKGDILSFIAEFNLHVGSHPMRSRNLVLAKLEIPDFVQKRDQVLEVCDNTLGGV